MIVIIIEFDNCDAILPLYFKDLVDFLFIFLSSPKSYTVFDELLVSPVNK